MEMKTALYNVLGVLLYKTNKTRDAIRTFKDLLEIDGSNLNGLENLAHILYALKCDTDSSKCKDRILKV